MRTFTIDSDDNISVFSSAEEAGQTAGVERFHSLEELMPLAERWPAIRLVEIWNSLTGVKPVKKFKDRKTAVARIWTAIQRLQPVGAPAKPKPDKDEVGKALERALGYASKAADFGEKTGQIATHLQSAVGWLGDNWHKLLPLVFVGASHCFCHRVCE